MLWLAIGVTVYQHLKLFLFFPFLRPLIQSLLDAYWKRTETIQLGGPTYLAPVIKMIAEYSQRNVSPQQYTVGCIIIDGVINDIDDTIDHIVQTGKLPLSLVVVGVGPADFRTMVRNFTMNFGFINTRSSHCSFLTLTEP